MVARGEDPEKLCDHAGQRRATDEASVEEASLEELEEESWARTATEEAEP